jgi:hypothetical protein
LLQAEAMLMIDKGGVVIVPFEEVNGPKVALTLKPERHICDTLNGGMECEMRATTLSHGARWVVLLLVVDSGGGVQRLLTQVTASGNTGKTIISRA